MKSFIFWLMCSAGFGFFMSNKNGHAFWASVAVAVVLLTRGIWMTIRDYDTKFSILEGLGHKFDVRATSVFWSIAFGFDSLRNEFVFIRRGKQPIVLSGELLIDLELTAEAKGAEIKSTKMKFLFKDIAQSAFIMNFHGRDGEKVYEKLRACDAIS